ncbi:MAG: prenyltransferase [Thermoplasmata archaeon]|nr:prenyltransferase [Thermoplasmata archaeon]
MIRAQFLIGIVFPLLVGTLTAISISGTFRLSGFILVMLMGLGLHLATDVYNDIYDTKQGADKKENERRNTYSGGSGILLEKPYLMARMYLIARCSLLLSFLAMLGLFFFINQTLWLYVSIIYFVSAFLSKYYTAAPFKFGYRGIGEILIWLSFGPIAIMLAGFSQNVMMQGALYAVMPATGFSTLTILWIGQLIDLPEDKSAGKIGLVLRMGTKRASYGYLVIQSLLMLNILMLVFFIFHPGWPLLLALIPFVVLLPKIWNFVKKYHADPIQLIPVATLNIALYVLFSVFFILGIGLTLL